MTSRSRNRSRTRFVVALVISLGVIGAGLWLLQRVYLQPAPEKVTVSNQAKAKVKDINLLGDKDLQGRYLTLVQDKQPDQAQQLFDNAVAAETDLTQKQALLRLNTLLALQTQQIDQAQAVAQRLIDLGPDARSYIQMAQVYATKKDFAKQKEYLLKAREVAQASTSPDKDNMITGLTSQINGIEQMEKMQQ